jgi:hypothetical protein
MKYIVATVIRKNAEQYKTPQVQNVDCTFLQVTGIFWLIPTWDQGTISGYELRMWDGRPTTDAIHVARVLDSRTNDTLYIALKDDGNEATVTDACNLCCDSTDNNISHLELGFPIPIPVMEEVLCGKDANGNYTFFAPVSANPFGNYYIPGFTYNGGLTLAGTPSATGYASLAALANWLNSNWSDGGANTWTVENYVVNGVTRYRVKLVSTTVYAANFSVSLVQKNYTLNLPVTPFLGTKLIIKNADLTDKVIDIPATTISEANRDVVKGVLQRYVTGTWSNSGNDLVLATLQQPVKVTDGNTNEALFS